MAFILVLLLFFFFLNKSQVYELVVESDEKGADGKPVVVHKTLAMPNEVRLHGGKIRGGTRQE